MAERSHKHAPWRRSILIPFWTLQTFFMLIIIALLAFADGVVISNEGQLENDGISTSIVHTATEIIVPVWITLATICMILTITEIILLARLRLKPLFFLVSNVIKSTIWTALFLLDLISAISSSERPTMVGVIVDVILLLSFYGPLIYGSGIYHKFRRDKKAYTPVDHSQDTSYLSQTTGEYGHFVSITPGRDIEVGSAPNYSYNDPRDSRFEPYSAAKNNQGGYSDRQAVEHTFGNSGSPSLHAAPVMREVPRVIVQHHDEQVHDEQVFEMDSRRSMR